MKKGDICKVVNPSNKRTSNGLIIEDIKKVEILKILDKPYSKMIYRRVQVKLLEGQLYRIAPREGRDKKVWITHLFRNKSNDVVFNLFSDVLQVQVQEEEIIFDFCPINSPLN